MGVLGRELFHTPQTFGSVGEFNMGLFFAVADLGFPDGGSQPLNLGQKHIIWQDFW